MNNLRSVIKNVAISRKDRILFILLFLLILSSIAISPKPVAGVYLAIKILEFSLLGVVLLINKNLVKKLLPLALQISIIFESLLALGQFINKGSINGVFYFFGERFFNSQTPNIANAKINGELILRPYGTFPHPNVLAGFLLISLTYLLFLYKPKEKYQKWIYFFSITLGSVSLLFSMSRVAIILFAIVLILKTIQFPTLKNKIDIRTFLTILILFIFTVFSFLPYRFSFNLSDVSISERLNLMNSSIQMIRGKPLFGVGLNNFLSELPNYYKNPQNVFYIQPVHNAPLLIVSEIGILAGIILLYFYFRILKKTDFAFKIILLEIFVLSLSDHYFLTIQQGQLLLVLALSLALTPAFQNDKIKK